MCVSILLGGNVIYADSHPHIMIHDNEKGTIWRKIKEESWAQEVFNSTKTRLNFYVEKHQQDTTWILERYLMNRVPGKYYTDFISDADGTQLIAYEGNAPVPTIRVSPHKRAPISPEGVLDINIDKMVPTARKMLEEIIEVQLSGDFARGEKYVNDYFVWTPEMETMAENILFEIARSRGLKKGADFDLDKAMIVLLKEFKSGEIGRISLDWL